MVEHYVAPLLRAEQIPSKLRNRKSLFWFRNWEVWKYGLYLWPVVLQVHHRPHNPCGSTLQVTSHRTPHFSPFRSLAAPCWRMRSYHVFLEEECSVLDYSKQEMSNKFLLLLFRHFHYSVMETKNKFVWLQESKKVFLVYTNFVT